MSGIGEIDKNFEVCCQIQKNDMVLYHALEAPFQIYGLLHDGERFRRMQKTVAESVSAGVAELSANTAGGRLRLVTDSPYVVLSAQMDGIVKMSHMPLTGSTGFDLYADDGTGEKYYGTFVPPFDIEKGYDSEIRLPGKKMRSITIHFPLYCNVKYLHIGLSDTAVLQEAAGYKYQKPVVYYGSSITQGGCASRPGNSYQSFISRSLDVDHINLGFSGNAKAEEEMIRYISELEMSVFVCDYDHNAPDVEHLQKTHLPLYRIFRSAQPTTPIIFISAPVTTNERDCKRRRSVIYETYDIAKSEGDVNVAFIDGETLYDGESSSCTVDNTHPNDLGFYRMAKRIEKEISAFLK